MTMYHGTTKDNYEIIQKTNILNAPVYLSPEKRISVEYAANNAADFVIIEVEVDETLFQADREFVSGLSEDWLKESLENGSVYVDDEISIESAKITEFQDYEEKE